MSGFASTSGLTDTVPTAVMHIVSQAMYPNASAPSVVGHTSSAVPAVVSGYGDHPTSMSVETCISRPETTRSTVHFAGDQPDPRHRSQLLAAHFLAQTCAHHTVSQHQESHIHHEDSFRGGLSCRFSYLMPNARACSRSESAPKQPVFGPRSPVSRSPRRSISCVLITRSTSTRSKHEV